MGRASKQDKAVVAGVTSAMGPFGLERDVKKLMELIDVGPSKDKFETACTFVVSFLRWSHDLEAKLKLAHQQLAVLRGEKDAQEESLAHHGPPVFTERDLHVSRAVVQWIATARKARSKAFVSFGYDKDWLPAEVDMRKSRLFWRLRSGKKPLPEPPPCAYSCPWYEVVEEDRPHGAYEMTVHDGKAHIAQCAYEIEEMNGTEPSIVKFNCYRFKVWRDSPTPDVKPFRHVWIQRIFETKEEEKKE